MGPKAIRKAYLEVLRKEIHSIDNANRRFWKQTTAHSREAGVAYYRRQDRLEEIRRELAAMLP